MQRLLLLLGYLLLSAMPRLSAQPVALSLDSCRALAVRNNKELRMADLEERAAYYERKAALTNYLPKISAAGTYQRTEKELSIASEEQRQMLGALGTMGQGLLEALHTDTRNLTAGAVLLTQPVFMGGKIAAYHRITRYAEQIAREQRDLKLQELIVEVDEAYWQIVSLQGKLELAESYLQLVRTLDEDVRKTIRAGMATEADGLSVRVKVNEAQVMLIKVQNGLSLSKMLLCQLCGLPLDTDLSLTTDVNMDATMPLPTSVGSDVRQAWVLRPELRALELASKVGGEKVKIARAEHLPTVALTGGYAATNPSLFNGFERKLEGMWSVGVVVNVPLLTWGERIYKVKAAKAQAVKTEMQKMESREKVELQVNQSSLRLKEAGERLNEALKSQEEADENLEHANVGLREGVIPVSNVLEAQTAWLSARSALLDARIDLRLADLYLKKSIGIIK